MQQVYGFDKPITIDQLIAEVKASKVDHVVEKSSLTSAYAVLYLNINLSARRRYRVREYGPLPSSYGAPAGGTITVRRNIPEPKAKARIEAVQEGNRLRLTVELEDDSTRRLYTEVHERWSQLKAHLEQYRGLQPYRQTVATGPADNRGKQSTETLGIRTTSSTGSVTQNTRVARQKTTQACRSNK